jgi:NAD-dependent SIR2 family protein deacetylase
MDATEGAKTGDSTRLDGLADSSESPATDFGSLSDFRTPYLTCSRCNSVVFINVLLVRPNDAVAAARKPVTEYEQVPACPGCGSTRYLRAGVVSFQEQIEEK